MKLVLMLEDEFERIQRFRTTIGLHHPDAELTVARTVTDFISAYRSLEKNPDLICLDHDLFPDSFDDPDPGDGRDVVKFLIQQTTKVPVLIHSSNNIAADSMLFALQDSGWNACRITPIGEDWIEADWYCVASMMASR